MEFTNPEKNLNFIIYDPRAGEMFEEIQTFFLYSIFDSSLEVLESETDNSSNPNFMFIDEESIQKHHSTDHYNLDLMFIDDDSFNNFCSVPQSWLKGIRIKDSRILKTRSSEEIKHIVEEIKNTFLKKIPICHSLLSDIGIKENQSSFESLWLEIQNKLKNNKLKNNKSKMEKFILFCFTVLCIRHIVAVNMPLVMEGRDCFETIDRKVRYELCQIFSEYVEQTIICTTEFIVNMPIDYNSNQLLSDMSRCKVYEIYG